MGRFEDFEKLNETRLFFQRVKADKKPKPMSCKNEDGELLTAKEGILTRWVSLEERRSREEKQREK